jgi:uncharacterized protein (TIGR02996 family)
VTTTDGDHLLRMILDQPAEDSHRLVYADWLGENAGTCQKCEGVGRLNYGLADGNCSSCYGSGQNGYRKRAEFIRVQIELARSHPNGMNRPVLQMACESLVEDNGIDALLGEEQFQLDYWLGQVERGFLCSVKMTLAEFQEHAKQLFSRHPITKVVITDREPAPSNLHPGLWRLWRWWADSNVPQESLGYGLYAMLDGYIPPEGNQPYWNSFEEAMAALSVACVAYGRKQAGLPALEANK